MLPDAGTAVFFIALIVIAIILRKKSQFEKLRPKPRPPMPAPIVRQVASQPSAPDGKVWVRVGSQKILVDADALSEPAPDERIH